MTDPLSATSAALADPTRPAILARLTVGPATVNEPAEPFQMSLPNVSRLLKVLAKAGMVSKTRAAQFRPCTLNLALLMVADRWLATCRAFFETRLDALEAHLAVMKADKT